MTRRLIPAVGAVLALLLSACTFGPGSHERWLRSHTVVASATSSQIVGRKLGERPAWHVTATLTSEATVVDMGQFAAQWPARAKGSRLTLVRPASDGRPELSFTAWPHAGWTETRWEIFALLHSTWPKAVVAIGEDQMGTVRLGRCDPWEELARIGVAEVLARENGVPLTVECRTGGTVELSRRSVPTTDHLTRLATGPGRCCPTSPRRARGRWRRTDPRAPCGSRRAHRTFPPNPLRPSSPRRTPY